MVFRCSISKQTAFSFTCTFKIQCAVSDLKLFWRTGYDPIYMSSTLTLTFINVVHRQQNIVQMLDYSWKLLNRLRSKFMLTLTMALRD